MAALIGLAGGVRWRIANKYFPLLSGLQGARQCRICVSTFAKAYPSQTKRYLAARLCHVYAEVMQTQLWGPNVGIAELGEDNLFHLGPDGLEPVTMVLVEIRRGCSLGQRFELGRRIVDVCGEVLRVPKRTVLVEFAVHSGDEMLRDGKRAGDRSPAEAIAESRATLAQHGPGG